MTEQQLTIVSLKTDTIQDLVGKIGRWHQSAISLATQSLDFAFKCGQALLEAKARVDHGKWLGWLAESCPNISERQAQRYMRVTQERPAIEAVVCDGPITIDGALSLIATRRPNPTATSDLKSRNAEPVELLTSSEMERAAPDHDEPLPQQNPTAPVVVGTVSVSQSSRLDGNDPEPESVRVRTDPETEAIRPTQAGADGEFRRLREKLGNVVTVLSRTKGVALGIEKSFGRSEEGEKFIRAVTTAHDDCESWGRLLREWSDTNGGGG